MKAEAKTVVANPGDSVDSSEVNESFVRKCELSKEQQALRKFGLLSFDTYRDWILENQLPLS